MRGNSDGDGGCSRADTLIHTGLGVCRTEEHIWAHDRRHESTQAMLLSWSGRFRHMVSGEYMWLNESELEALGLAEIGIHAQIDSGATILSPQSVRIGSRVRIDHGAFLAGGAGGLWIGSHVHVAVGTKIYASSSRVEIDDFAGLSAGVCVFSATDDYSGGALTNPTVPEDLREIRSAPVHIGRHVIVGANSVILPGATLGEGASVGALTFVNRSVPSGAIVSGNPMRRVGTRDIEKMRRLESELIVREIDENG